MKTLTNAGGTARRSRLTVVEVAREASTEKATGNLGHGWHRS